MDVTEPDSWQAGLAKATEKYGLINVLYNNAGGSTQVDDTAVNVPLEEFWRAIKLDLFGTFLGCRFGIPEIIKAGGGSVINMASNVALMGFPGRDAADQRLRRLGPVPFKPVSRMKGTTVSLLGPGQSPDLLPFSLSS